ncbi:MAG: TetR/AcrR family transcriptional regulator [Oscillospiraceae bacterium]|nr:TetR/AcrR family transcriptional regulator [Oscillospiraceae bacterium]
MARSEKAEQTYRQILEASTKLFFTQGYEKTSIQDILDELKMSRGVVYYYFKSKKEILDAITSQRLDEMRSLIQETQAENARGKIVKILSALIGNVEDVPQGVEEDLPLEHMADPHIVLANMQAQTNDAKLLLGLFEEGVRDGSIQTEYPLQLAELMFMLFSTWLNPILFKRDLEQTTAHLKFVQQTLSKLGADVLSDEMISQIIKNWKQLAYFN